MVFRKISESEKEKAYNLLIINKLPIEDISENVMLFGAFKGEKMLGIIGLEVLKEGNILRGLLRSTAVEIQARTHGIGTFLVAGLEKQAAQTGISELYLLTTSAENFFQKLNFEKIVRENAPLSLKQTGQFSDICPASATIMKKKISEKMEKKRLLFVCIENSNRSQMAQAFAKIHGGDAVEAFSAGSRPSGKVNPKAVEAMQLLGYDLTKHASKSLGEVPQDETYDYVITMGCGDECPFIPAKHHIDWQIPDPRHLEMPEFLTVRDLIEQKVKEILK